MPKEFKKLLEGVKKIKSETSSDFCKIPKNKTFKKKAYDDFEDFIPAQVSLENFTIESEDFLEYKGNGVQNSVFKKLKKAQIPVEENIDLHGMNILDAEMYLQSLLETIDTGFMMCVRVVHGKGYHTDKDTYQNNYPKIKNFTYRYLKQHKRTLAFVSCPPNRGGNGSLLVLLKALN